ncbi:hypothetical protein [Acinetobacter sp. YH16055]|uniref:hypothetical protein n=1 Tax=Acinetobacter sp. YH16055 TaxID=2601193 RepID=UPI0015D27BCD|nr:hypothetical protein [Acinetobacter sp. YH16055]
MFNRFMLCIALGIQSSFALTHAANDLEKWNSESGKVARSAMREKLKTTTYRELPNHVDSSYRSTANGGKVLRQIETNATVKGSRVGTTIEALKDVDKMGAAKKFAKELGKGGVRFTVGAVLIEAAMQEMLDGIGWIIDEGGKVTKKPQEFDSCLDGSLCKNLQYLYKYRLTELYSTVSGACSAQSKNISSVNGKTPANTFELRSDGLACRFGYTDGSYTSYYVVTKVGNTFYDSSSTPSTGSDLSESEMIDKIRDYFENPQSPASKDLLIEQAEKPRGKASIMWSDDPSSEQTIYSDNKKTTEKVLQSDNPVADGLTKETPKITDGTSASGESNTESSSNTNVNETTRPNPDGSTTTTGNNTTNNTTNNTFNFELPAFCDYAAIVCDWIDWTKEEPEKEEEQEQETINDKGIFDREFDIKFEFEKSCPPDYVFNFETKYIAGSYKFTFNWLCMFFSGISYPLVFLSHCLGAWIFYEIAVRRGNQGA